MSGDDELERFGALLDAFVAAQRRAAIDETRKQRITVTRDIEGFCRIGYETVIDEGTAADEIFRLFAPIDAAIDRLKAKAEVRAYLEAALNQCGSVEHQCNKLEDDRRDFERKNAALSENRRQRVVLTEDQIKALRAARESINEQFARVDEQVKAADESAGVLAGADPLELLRDKLDRRLDAMRGRRGEAA